MILLAVLKLGQNRVSGVGSHPYAFNLQVDSRASILRLTKAGLSHGPSSSLWVTLTTTNSSNYEAIAWGHFNDSVSEPTVILDKGRPLDITSEGFVVD